jgi:hypothetical protein
MSRVPWHLIQDRQRRAHLVVGVVVQAEGPVSGDELNAVAPKAQQRLRSDSGQGHRAATS